MNNLALRKAVAKCAGWEWNSDYAWDAKASQGRLAVEEPLPWDDVMAACEAALQRGVLKKRMTIVIGVESIEQVAHRLCRLCGVEVEDE